MNEALKVCKSDKEKLSLENLKSDLKELLGLTQETLQEQNVSTTNTASASYNLKDPFAYEMDLFMAEISKETENEPSTASANYSPSTSFKSATKSVNKKLDDIKVR